MSKCEEIPQIWPLGPHRSCSRPQNNKIWVLTHIYPHTKFERSNRIFLELLPMKGNLHQLISTAKKADVLRLGMTLKKEVKEQIYACL